ncbi:MAG TPA: DUF1385 domain-containing protein [Polyangiales bacterium]|nr:DUF1385 domain-containing protein [Polyangiales bacterium]
MAESSRPYIGGQAVIEGVMMRAPKCLSVAVRRPDGTIAVREGPLRAKLLNGPYSKIPGLRGVVMLFESMSLGYGALRFSAEQQLTEQERAEAKDSGGAVAISVILALSMFILLPQGLTSGLGKLLGTSWDLQSPMFHAVTGGFKLLVFTLYLSLISRVPEVKRVFQYHGAEHKTIFAYEAGKVLTVENVRAESRLHPRCGTTFLVVVIGVSIVMGAFSTPILLPTAKGTSGFLLTFLLRVALLPFVAAISYELQRISARHCTTGPLRVLLYPGFLFQQITTREPDDAQLEIAIAAMELARVRDARPADPSAPDELHVYSGFAEMSAAVALPQAAE